MTGKANNRTTIPGAKVRARHGLTALALCGIVAGMLGLSFAAVPLYRMFCQVTGYGGTTQRAEALPDRVLDKRIAIRFDANTAQGLAWQFQPEVRRMELRVGEQGLAFYKAHNLSSRTVRGTATFNVTPESAGSYFNKIDCFCFTEQALGPGETVDMPVTFFVDPEIVDDPDTRGIREITLSYTFFPVEDKDVDKRAGREQGS